MKTVKQVFAVVAAVSVLNVSSVYAGMHLAPAGIVEIDQESSEGNLLDDFVWFRKRITTVLMGELLDKDVLNKTDGYGVDINIMEEAIMIVARTEDEILLASRIIAEKIRDGRKPEDLVRNINALANMLAQEMQHLNIAVTSGQAVDVADIFDIMRKDQEDRHEKISAIKSQLKEFFVKLPARNYDLPNDLIINALTFKLIQLVKTIDEARVIKTIMNKLKEEFLKEDVVYVKLPRARKKIIDIERVMWFFDDYEKVIHKKITSEVVVSRKKRLIRKTLSSYNKKEIIFKNDPRNEFIRSVQEKLISSQLPLEAIRLIANKMRSLLYKNRILSGPVMGKYLVSKEGAEMFLEQLLDRQATLSVAVRIVRNAQSGSIIRKAL